MIIMNFANHNGLANQPWVYVTLRSVACKLKIDYARSINQFIGKVFLNL